MEMTYKEFIDNILETRGRFNCGEEYHECHHIVPKCMGGTNDEENLIDLFAREHFEAHRLLALENPNVRGLQFAWWNMSTVTREDMHRYKIAAEEYEEVRKVYAEKFSGYKNPSARRVIRLCDDKIYNTIKDCYIDNNISNTTMWGMLKIHRDFMYYDEYINMSECERKEVKSIDWNVIQHINRSEAAKKSGNGGSIECSSETRAKISAAHKGKNGINIYCPQLDESFVTIKSASEKYNICRESIRACICGKQKHAGKHPVTREPLSWGKLENKIC